MQQEKSISGLESRPCRRRSSLSLSELCQEQQQQGRLLATKHAQGLLSSAMRDASLKRCRGRQGGG